MKNQTKTNLPNTIIGVLFCLLLFCGGFITRCAIDNNTTQSFSDKENEYQAKIDAQNGKIETLLDSVSIKQEKIEYLEKIKQEKIIIWKTKLIELQNISLTEQYELLSLSITDVCGLQNAGFLYTLNKDTFALFNNDEILCINSAFIDREYCIEQLGYSEDIIAELNNVNSALTKIITYKDSIITYKDSIIIDNKNKVQFYKKQNKHLKIGIGTAILSTILALFVK